MGIQGLLPLLKSIHKPTSLRAFVGQTLGVDAYGWLHRGTVACAIELAQCKPTTKFVDFAMHRVRMLIHFGVKPYIVFDGDYLPSKAGTERERRERRREAKRLGLELLRKGRISDAHAELQKAVDVTPEMARQFIEELRKSGVDYVVAPYEADAQLAYLEQKGIINGIISEDSDLLVFGTQTLLTKLDQYGDCVMIRRQEFTACREISLVGWTDNEFRIMAMLSGCDYLPSIDKMGLRTAYRLVRKHKTVENIVRTVQFDGKMKVPAGYLEAFRKAEETFLYQWVFCPEKQCLVNLTLPPKDSDVAEMLYIGKFVHQEVAVSVALGDLHPNTKERLTFDRPERKTWTRSTTINQTPELKKDAGKTITEFFKAKRTPLQELDPNSFTPSPSQQRLLHTNQQNTWSASQVSASRRVTSVPTGGVRSTAPQASRRTVSAQYKSIDRASPKRLRLCSDIQPNLSASTETARSKFFAASGSASKASPSLRKASAQRKKNDFSLWSDEDLEEAMTVAADQGNQLMPAQPTALVGDLVLIPAESAQTPHRRKKLKVFADLSANACKDASTVQKTAVESEEEPAEHSMFSAGIEADMSALRSKYAFKSATPKTGISRTHSTPVAHHTPLVGKDRNAVLGRLRRNSHGLSTKEHVNLVEDLYDTRNGASPDEADTALVPDSSPPPGATKTPRGEWTLSTLQTRVERDQDKCQPPEPGIEEDDCLAIETHPVSPESRPSPKQSLPHDLFLDNGGLILKGSEDFLVPNTPESDSDGDTRQLPLLDLGRFAFAG